VKVNFINIYNNLSNFDINKIFFRLEFIKLNWKKWVHKKKINKKLSVNKDLKKTWNLQKL